MTGSAPPQRKSDRTRNAILDAAKELFAERGYENATVRDIAARAAIDPAMVIRYFGSKEELFTRASAFDLKLSALGPVKPSGFGEALVLHFLDIWEGGNTDGAMTILLRSAASSEYAAAKIREIFATQVMPVLVRVSGRDIGAARAGLISTQLLGLALCRYVLKLPPVVAMSREDIVRHIGRTIQRYADSA